MVKLDDFSHLREGRERVEIPLNGATYWAIPEPPADVLMEATQLASGPELAELQRLVEKAAAGTDEERALLEADPGTQLAAARMGGDMAVRAVRMLQAVLEPESLERWVANMKPYPPLEEGATAAKRKRWEEGRAQHDRERISAPQLMSVWRGLMAHYGGRPTTPSGSSVNGSGSGGGTSMAGAPAGK